jgi:PhzF family phenazine biosynthesis protein
MKKSIDVYEVRAFSRGDEGGNLAGVVLERVDNNLKQGIAKRLGYSETVFIERTGEREFHLEYFTPGSEVDLCGHATIGGIYVLKEVEGLEEGSYTIETRAGMLQVEVGREAIFMEQNHPAFYGKVERSRVAESLNIKVEALGNLPVEIVSTGLKDILVSVRSLEVMREIKPDFKGIEEISREYGVVGYHLFTLESIEGNTAFTRNFAPLYEIDEESATGTSNGALAGYLKKYKLIEGERMRFEQGDYMGNPSRIDVRLDEDRLMVGGEAALSKRFVIEV